MSGFDKFMVSNTIGTNRKVRRLPVVQRWAYVAGVLALAAKSPLRGALLITDKEPVTADDIAAEATVPVAAARAALDSLRNLGMLETDEHGVEWVHGWDEINPTPRVEAPDGNASRRKALQRDPVLREAIRCRDGDWCRYCGNEVRWTDRRGALGGTYDHLDPAGSNSLENLVVACRRCNSVKGKRTVAEAAYLGIQLRPEPKQGLVGTRSQLNEVEEEVEEQLPPNPPHGGSDTALHLVGDEPPVRPSSRRKRDIERWHTDVAAWEQRHPTLPASSEETAVWSETRKALREMVSESTYDIWLKPLRLLGTRDGVLLLEAPHHIASWVQDRFADNLAAAFAERGIYAWQLITGPSTSTNGAAA